jgi:hypothetical protein
MATSAVFPGASVDEGMYESFYLRAVSPREPLGVWIRYTVHKRPGHRPTGSVWCTVFDAASGRPFMHKLTTDDLSVPAGGWIGVGDSRLTPESAEGACGPASWALRFASEEPELRHLRREWLYRAPFPRTKLSSPYPAATFEGYLDLEGRRLDLTGWSGMVGHNWGSEHAERWIWLHGIGFQDAPGAWLDVAIGRVRVAGRTSPWVANGALSLDGRRRPMGGLLARGLRVSETTDHCVCSLPGPAGLTVEVRAQAPPEGLAGWQYADPIAEDRSQADRSLIAEDPAMTALSKTAPSKTAPSKDERSATDQPKVGRHDVTNCSIAALELVVNQPGHPPRTLRTEHGAVYELGRREHDHGVPIAPFADG